MSAQDSKIPGSFWKTLSTLGFGLAIISSCIPPPWEGPSDASPQQRECLPPRSDLMKLFESDGSQDHRIRPSRVNACYWEYKGEPVLLLGASDEEDLFNHPDIWPFGLESHLDLMVRYGGNYVRNAMSGRHPDPAWPFALDETGLYDLERWNEEYWERLERFLQMTHERDIIVQVELWNRVNFARKPWEENPFNPKNNLNYTVAESGLPEEIPSHPGARRNPFFRTPPQLEDNQLVREFQVTLVARILSHTLPYPHVLYTISNETNESPLWSEYWARMVHENAAEHGVEVHVTEMWDPWDLSHPLHRATFNNPSLYTFADVSQNNHQGGQVHWDNAQWALARHLAHPPRPVNNVKIYGGPAHGESLEEGTRRFWRNIFGGMASARFHRTFNHLRPSGAGLSPLAQVQMKSLRMLTDSMNIFQMSPRMDLLSQRRSDEAYLMAEEGRQYAVYFPDGGAVAVNLSAAEGPLEIRWINIMTSRWTAPESIAGGESVQISPPGEGPWAALLLAVESP